jgi:hypothetical protein
MATYEELDSVWNEVEGQLAQRGWLVFPADLDPGNGPRAFWPDGPISEFLDLAEQLGAAPIFASAARFEPDDVDDLARFLGLTSSQTANALLQQAQEHVGDVYEIQVAFIHLGTPLIWVGIADWHEEMQARADEEADSAEVVRSAERSLQEDAWIQALAASVKFERAKTLDQRLRVAEQTFPELEQMRSHSDPWARSTPLRIVRSAWDLYLEEIQPEQERSIANQANALLEHGVRKYEVAGRLGVSENKLNRILAQHASSTQAR